MVQSYDPSQLGRAVGIRYIGYTCGFCHYCLRGLPESCSRQIIIPKHCNGTYQEFATLPWSSLVPLPEWVFDQQSKISPALYATALCSGSAALRAVREASVHPNDVVIVIGIMGAIGHLCGLILRKVYAAKVIGIDLAWKLEATTQESEEYYDKTLAIPDRNDRTSEIKFYSALEEFCRDLRGGCSPPRLADSVINTATSSDAFQGLEELVCDGGYIVCVG